MVLFSKRIVYNLGNYESLALEVLFEVRDITERFPADFPDVETEKIESVIQGEMFA